MKYTALIFDFDFTLANATPGIVGSVNYALEQLGFEPRERGEIRRTVGMTLRDTFISLTKTTDDDLIARFSVLFKEKADVIMTENTVLFGDTIKILSRLKHEGRSTGIVTGKFHYRIDDVLAKYSITHLIDFIIGYEDVKSPKPSPEGLLAAIAALGAEKDKVLYIGDSIIDAKTAAAAEVDFAAVLTGTTAAEHFFRLPGAYIAKNLTELFS